MNEIKSEATLVIIKPDGIKKSLTGNILSRFAEARLNILATKMVVFTREMTEKHYCELTKEPFFEGLAEYIMGKYHTSRTMFLIYYGPDAINKIRAICGATNPEEADVYTIRGSYGRITTKGVFENVVHASANTKDAEREIKLWFNPDEIKSETLFSTKDIENKNPVRVWA
ncbi:MAG: nucleoside-diphosphate kinase [Candidatus Omnitrophota bacterium]|jgi:nucleoside-diphosphate kinase